MFEILSRDHRNLTVSAHHKAYRASNFFMVEAYWNIGRMIVEEERQNKARSRYGEQLMVRLAARLSVDFGKGYGTSNLFWMRQFFMSYPIFHAARGKLETVSGSATHKNSLALRTELSWTHYRLLLRVENPEARAWYMNEAADQNWSTRALERQIGSLYYERLLMSQSKRRAVKSEAGRGNV